MPFIVTPPGLLTVLGAVNMALSGIRKFPVGDLTDATLAGDPEVARARSTLDTTDLGLQGRGWWFNREYAYPLLPQSVSPYHVNLPDETLDLARAYFPSGYAGTPNVIARGTTLYDVDRRSYDFSAFTSGVLVDITIRLDWDSLPSAYRQVCALMAARTFIAQSDSSSSALQVSSADLTRAWATLENQDDRANPKNSINGNISAIAALHGLGGLRRNRAGA